MAFKTPIAPAAKISYTKYGANFEFFNQVIKHTWAEGERKLNRLIGVRMSVDDVCDNLVRHCNAYAAVYMNRSENKSFYEASKFVCKSYQIQSGAFVFVLGYDLKSRTYDVQVKFEMTPGICRRCGCVDDDCRDCIQRTGEPCSWVEHDLCSACTKPMPL